MAVVGRRRACALEMLAAAAMRLEVAVPAARVLARQRGKFVEGVLKILMLRIDHRVVAVRRQDPAAPAARPDRRVMFVRF